MHTRRSTEAVLDLFRLIVYQGQPEAFQDLFDLMQPAPISKIFLAPISLPLARISTSGPDENSLFFFSFSARCEQYYCKFYCILLSPLLFIDISDEHLHALVR